MQVGARVDAVGNAGANDRKDAGRTFAAEISPYQQPGCEPRQACATHAELPRHHQPIQLAAAVEAPYKWGMLIDRGWGQFPGAAIVWAPDMGALAESLNAWFSRGWRLGSQPIGCGLTAVGTSFFFAFVAPPQHSHR